MAKNFIYFLFGIHLCQSVFHIRKQWDGGFFGGILIPLSKGINDWQLEVQFDRVPKIEVLFDDVEFSTSTDRFVFKSRKRASWYNGSMFTLEFRADGITPYNVINATFNNEDVNLTMIFDPPSSVFSGEPINILENDNQYNYSAVLYASLLFYESQRAGKLPSTNRIDWRNDSMLNDGKSRGIDLVGGYFNDGDDLTKNTHIIAGFTTTIAWGVIEYEDAYIKANQLKDVHDAIRWSMDYLIKVHTTATHDGFYERVGDTAVNDRWYRPEDWPIYQHTVSQCSCHARLAVLSPSFFLIGEAIGELIACFAATSIVFRSYDNEYSLELLKHAEELYKVAVANPFRTLDRKDFGLDSPGDEIAWARIWLFRATNKSKYLFELETFLSENKVLPRQSSFRIGSRGFGVLTLLAKLTKHKRYIKQVKQSYDFLLTARIPQFDVSYCTQCVANLAFLFLQADDLGIESKIYLNFAVRQIGYMLGDTGRSFVVGIGQNYPQRPRDRASSCPPRPATCNSMAFENPHPNPYLLIGALVMGSHNYTDNRQDERENTVSLGGNAGFQSAVAGLLHYRMKKLI